MARPRVFSVDRLRGNPILYRGSEAAAGVGENINGPSLIRAPSWVAEPLGRYYLYFAHHRGTSIRLAVADALSGPWRVVDGGCLSLEESGFPTDGVRPHIASPDVHVDEVTQTVRMYFHGHETGTGEQFTRLATSSDGVSFRAHRENLGRPYLRAFAWEGAVYGLAKPGILYRSSDGVGGFERGPRILEKSTRHVALLVRGAELLVFYTRIGDAPERILCATVPLTGDWHRWRASDPVEVLAPEEAWEGAELALEPSVRAWSDVPVRQLRDPAIFEEDGKTYLLYSVAGESGIAIARLGIAPASWRSVAAEAIERVDPGLRLLRQAAVTLVAVLLSFGSAYGLKQAAGLTPSVEVLAVALAISLSRVGARPDHRGVRTRAVGLAVLPLVALLASEIGTLMFQHADIGDALFVVGVSATIYVRRFGDRARRIATFAVLPLISTLIVPGPISAGVGHSGSSGRWWAALVAVIALGWVTVMRWVAVRWGWIVEDAVVPARAAPRPRTADGARRMAGSTKMALQMAAALTAAFALGRWLFGDEHWSWCVLTAFIVSSGNRGREDVAHKAVLRLGGALVGTLAATLLSGLFPAGDSLAIVVIFGVLAVALWLRSFNYGFWAAGMTAALALLYSYYGEDDISLLASRLEGILLGAAVAVTAAWLLWPVRTGDVIRRDVGAALGALDRWLDGLVEAPDRSPDAARAVREAVAALEVHVALLHGIPRPLRTRIDHLPALTVLQRCGRSVGELPARPGVAVDQVAHLRGVAGALRRANGQAVLPDPSAWEDLAVGVGELAPGTALAAPVSAEDRWRQGSTRVLGYINRTHGTQFVLGDLVLCDGETAVFEVADPGGPAGQLHWVRKKDAQLAEVTCGELARGRTPSGFPYAVLSSAAEASSSAA